MADGNAKLTKGGRVKTKLFRSELRYRRLFESAPDGILMLDPETRKITDANPFISKLLGYTRRQLLHKELWQIGLLEDEAASRKAFRELRKNGFIRYEDLPLESKSGQRREVEFVSKLYDEGGEHVIQCNIRDITARKRTEQALHASEQRYRALFDLGPVAVYSCDADGLIQDFNRGAVKLWGRTPKLDSPSERFCGSYKLYTPAGTLMPHHRCPVAAVLQGKLPNARDFEVIIERPDGSKVTAIANIVPLKNAHGKITGAINCLYEITARKQAEDLLRQTQVLLAQYTGQLESLVAKRTAELTAKNKKLEAARHAATLGEEKYQRLFLESQAMQRKLRHLTHQILTAQEEERKEISRELHDEVVQMLVGINVELAALSKGASVGWQVQKGKIAHTQRLVENSVTAVHQFARALRPAVLDDLGLIPALLAFGQNLAERKKFKIKMTAFAGVESLDNAKRTVLFRVAQEALTNVARHAQATLVKIHISELAGAVRMEIADNGHAFSVDRIIHAKNPKRLGLVGMKERIEMVGGTLAIESVPGQGTTVRTEIPFPSRRPKK